jgi:hypothetical protein
MDISYYLVHKIFIQNCLKSNIFNLIKFKNYNNEIFFYKKFKTNFKKHFFIIYLLPFINFKYNKYNFLETGVYTPSFELKCGWLFWNFELVVQETY